MKSAPSVNAFQYRFKHDALFPILRFKFFLKNLVLALYVLSVILESYFDGLN